MDPRLRLALAFAFFVSAVLAAIVLTSRLSAAPRVVLVLAIVVLAGFLAFSLSQPPQRELYRMVLEYERAKLAEIATRAENEKQKRKNNPRTRRNAVFRPNQVQLQPLKQAEKVIGAFAHHATLTAQAVTKDFDKSMDLLDRGYDEEKRGTQRRSSSTAGDRWRP